MEKHSRNNNKVLWIAGAAGLIGGAVAGFWLNSQQGRKWRSDTATKMAETRDNVRSGMEHQMANLRAQGEALMSKGQEWLKKTEVEATNGESAVEKGTKKAKAKIDEITS